MSEIRQEWQAVKQSAEEARAAFCKTMKLGVLLSVIVLIVVTAIARIALV